MTPEELQAHIDLREQEVESLLNAGRWDDAARVSERLYLLCLALKRMNNHESM